MLFALPLTHRLFFGLFSVLTLLLLGAWCWLASPQIPHPTLGPYNHYHCHIPRTNSSAHLHVMTPIAYLAPELANALCNQPALGQAFGHVDIHWPDRNSLHGDQLLSGQYGLLWNRAEVLQGMVHDYDQLYSEIMRLPRYSVYFIGRTSTPALNTDYFASHRLGLLQDHQSYSGYQLAMVALAQAGIQLKPENLRVYPDRAAQLNALENGDVDVISGLPFDAAGKPLAEERLLLIANEVSSGGWFLHQSLQEQRLRCAIIAALHSQDILLARMGKAQWQDEGCAQ